jgi:hypothetical protein
VVERQEPGEQSRLRAGASAATDDPGYIWAIRDDLLGRNDVAHRAERSPKAATNSVRKIVRACIASFTVVPFV